MRFDRLWPRLSFALLLLLPTACRAPRVTESPAELPFAGTRYALHTTIRGAPLEAGLVRVELAVPRQASRNGLVAVALVGNAPFEFRLPRDEPGRFANGPLVLEWTPATTAGTAGALVVEARGRCPEVGLRFELDDPLVGEVDDLREAFRSGTHVAIDGRDWNSVTTRLELR